MNRRKAAIMEKISNSRLDSITKNIKRIREEKQYSQEYLAAKLEISQNAYSKVECGHTALTLERLYLISLTLETDMWEILNLDRDGISRCTV